MTSALLERITAPSGFAGAVVGKIDFPDGFAPVPSRDFSPLAGAPMAKASVCVLQWTTAEKEAGADVLTPGVHWSDWAPYTRGWASIESQLTGRSPAREAKCAARYWPLTLNGLPVNMVGSELHLSTDGPSIPLMQLVAQIVEDSQPDLVLSIGTAGGTLRSEVLGDVIFASAVKANMAGSQWASEPWAQQRFEATFSWPGYGSPAAGYVGQAFEKLIPAVVGDHLKLPESLTVPGYEYRLPEPVFGRETETIPIFGFADTADAYGVLKNDPAAGVEEMDDACVALALSRLPNPPKFMSIRNVSDPMMGGGPLPAQKKEAAAIYDGRGYWTSVCSALGMWGAILDRDQD